MNDIIKDLDEILATRLRQAEVHVWATDDYELFLKTKREIERLRAENDYIHSEALRLMHAVEYAHSEGFEWPHDPIPKLSPENDK
jgi:hypothetical protein